MAELEADTGVAGPMAPAATCHTPTHQQGAAALTYSVQQYSQYSELVLVLSTFKNL